MLVLWVGGVKKGSTHQFVLDHVREPDRLGLGFEHARVAREDGSEVRVAGFGLCEDVSPLRASVSSSPRVTYTETRGENARETGT